jgi:hypothetical protein
VKDVILSDGKRSNDIRNALKINKIYQVIKVKSKSKAVPLQAMEALQGRGGIAPTHS